MAVNRLVRSAAIGLGITTILAGCGPEPSDPARAMTERISITSSVVEPTGNSDEPAISSDGNVVAFVSSAPNLVIGDNNEVRDVFIWYRQSAAIRRVSVSSNGIQANKDADRPSVSADGRHVIYESEASTLVPGDTNGETDIFLWDDFTGTTERISVASDGTQANNYSSGSAISADGRYVAFSSLASNLVPGDTNGKSDIFVRDRLLGTTQRISVTSDGAESNNHSYDPSISADGRYVSYTSWGSNITPGNPLDVSEIVVWDRESNTTQLVTRSYDGGRINGVANEPSISANGNYIAYQAFASNIVPNDNNNAYDVFLWDRTTGTSRLVSATSSGSPGNEESAGVSISADGRYVAYDTLATNLVPGDTNETNDVLVWDRYDGSNRRISVANDGTQANAYSYEPSISGGGRFVAYTSAASNLVSGDHNNRLDVFLWDRKG